MLKRISEDRIHAVSHPERFSSLKVRWVYRLRIIMKSSLVVLFGLAAIAISAPATF